MAPVSVRFLPSRQSVRLHHCGLYDLSDALGGGLQVAVSDMGVAQGHHGVGVSEHPRDGGQGNAPGDGLAGDRMPEIVQADVVEAGLRPSGHRSFVWHGRVQGEPVRRTVGPAALMTVEDARKGALALRVGNAPRKAEGRSGAPLFRDFVLDEWWPAYRRRCAPSSCQFANRVLKRQLIPAFGRLPLDAIRRIDVERWFDAYSRTAPGGANKALEILGQIMNAAFAAGHVGTSPVRGIAKNCRPKLTRFLSAEEIERLHRVLDRLVKERPSRRQQADIVRLLLLTGCRKGEILKLQWSEVDGDRLNLTDTKTGPRKVWLSKAAQAILARQPRAASPYVFPSPRRPDKPLSHILHLWQRARKEPEMLDHGMLGAIGHPIHSGEMTCDALAEWPWIDCEAPARTHDDDERSSLAELLDEVFAKTGKRVRIVVRAGPAGLALMGTGPYLSRLPVTYLHKLPEPRLRPLPIEFGRARFRAGIVSRSSAWDFPAFRCFAETVRMVAREQDGELRSLSAA